MTKWTENIEKISYGGALYYDNTVGFPVASVADNFPIGTKDKPCNNFIDLMTLAGSTGIKNIILLTSCGAGIGGLDSDIDAGLTLIGQDSSIEVDLASRDVDDVTFINMNLTGTQGGAGTFLAKSCMLSLDSINACLGSECTLNSVYVADGGSFVLSNSESLSVLTGSTGFLVGSTTGTIMITNYTGQLAIDRVLGTQSVYVNGMDGAVGVGGGCTGGTVNIVSGSGTIDDQSTSTIVTVSGDFIAINTTINTDLEHNSEWKDYAQYGEGVFYDSSSTNSGITWPMGTRYYPVNDFADALAICKSVGVTSPSGEWKITLFSNLVVPSPAPALEWDVANIIIDGNEGWQIDLNGQVLDNLIINNADVIGTQGHLAGPVHSFIRIQNGWVGNLVDANISAYDTEIYGTLSLVDGHEQALIRCYSYQSLATISVANPTLVDIIDFSGDLGLENLVGGAISVSMRDGTLLIDATCTAGIIDVSGTCRVTDNGTSTLTDNTLYAQVGPYSGDNGIAIDSNVKAELDIIDSKVDSVGTQVSVVDSKVDSVGTQVSVVDSKVDSVGTQVSVVDSKVDSVGSQVDSVGTQVSVVDSKVDSVGVQVASIAVDVSTVISKVDSVGSQVDSAVSDIDSTVVSTATNTDSKVDSVGTQVSTVDSKVDSVGGGTDLSVISTAISTIDTEVKTSNLIVGGGSIAANARTGSLVRWTADAIAGIAGVNSYQEFMPDPTIAAGPLLIGGTVIFTIANADLGATEKCLRGLWINTTRNTSGNVTYSLGIETNPGATSIVDVYSVVVSADGWQNLMDLFGLQDVNSAAIRLTGSSPNSDATCVGIYHYATAV